MGLIRYWKEKWAIEIEFVPQGAFAERICGAGTGAVGRDYKLKLLPVHSLINFIIQIYRQDATVCSFVETFL